MLGLKPRALYSLYAGVFLYNLMSLHHPYIAMDPLSFTWTLPRRSSGVQGPPESESSGFVNEAVLDYVVPLCGHTTIATVTASFFHLLIAIHGFTASIVGKKLAQPDLRWRSEQSTCHAGFGWAQAACLRHFFHHCFTGHL